MSDGERHLEYVAPAISCEHCKRAIEAAVGAVHGVESVVVDVQSKTVRVAAGPEVLPAEVRAAIEAAGYPVTGERELD